MDFITFINQNIFTIGIVVVIIFAIWMFYLRPKFFSGKKKVETQNEVIPTNPTILPSGDTTKKESNSTGEKEDTSVKRIGRGFGVLSNKLKVGYEKVANSDYVKGIQEEQGTTKVSDMMPTELFNQNEKEEDLFSTDFSKLTKVDI